MAWGGWLDLQASDSPYGEEVGSDSFAEDFVGSWRRQLLCKTVAETAARKRDPLGWLSRLGQFRPRTVRRGKARRHRRGGRGARDGCRSRVGHHDRVEPNRKEDGARGVRGTFNRDGSPARSPSGPGQRRAESASRSGGSGKVPVPGQIGDMNVRRRRLPVRLGEVGDPAARSGRGGFAGAFQGAMQLPGHNRSVPGSAAPSPRIRFHARWP